MDQRSSSSTGDTLVSLPEWLESEDRKQSTSSVKILRKTTVAYGISELVRYSRAHPPPAQSTSTLSVVGLCDARNFVIRISQGLGSHDIAGVDMLSPRLSADIVEPPFLCSGDGDEGDGMAGRYLEVELTTHSEDSEGALSSGAMFSQSDEEAQCHSLGTLLCEVFSFRPRPNVAAMRGHPPHAATTSQEKKMRLCRSASNDISSVADPGAAVADRQTQRHGQWAATSLMDLQLPASVALLVRNLIECTEDHRPRSAYDSLEGAVEDLHLLLLDPKRFLFDSVPPYVDGTPQLSLRTHKLYGREEEASVITDAFCRVSCGTSEAVFVEGFSGSGKSRLVNSLTARIDVANGYVIVHKFQMSNENQLSGVIAAFDDLCLLVREKRTQREIEEISVKLTDVFGGDLSMLAQLLPNIRTLSPPMDSSAEKEDGDRIVTSNLQSICFLLRHFIAVVSSPENPVMLFWDDLQWSELPSLTVVEEMLATNTGSSGSGTGSSCLFFVGSYRNNEIPDDHALFPFMRRLTSSGVPTTKITLDGLRPKHLNALVSDALCMFPRLAEPLSDIIFQKTQGNPFFTLALISDMVDRKFLEYSLVERCWVWDEDHIRSTDVTDNVLDLLSSKISTLSQDAKLVLKVASCFGTRIKRTVHSCLGETSQYANIWAPGVKKVFGEGFVVRAGTSDWKWVHDKVREAAYSLIPDNEKNQFHFGIGMAMYDMMTKQTTTGINNIVFDIADQINKGVNDEQSPELRLDLAELNEMVGTKAATRSDHVAAHSYFEIALSLLPPNHWESHYDRSLRLYFFSATSAYSNGDDSKAVALLRHIIHQACCIEDKLKSYYRLIVIFCNSGRIKESFSTACDILSQLGEVIPEAIGDEESEMKLKATSSKLLRCATEEYFQSAHTQSTMERRTESILDFYSMLTFVSFCWKPELTVVFVHRMVQLSINHAVSIYSLAAIMHYSAMVSYNNSKTADILEACRIAKLAMKAFSQFDAHSDLGHMAFGMYHCFVAPTTEALQVCADCLHRRLESKIAHGVWSCAFITAIHAVRLAFHAGTELPTLLKRCEHYLTAREDEYAKAYLALFRDTLFTITGKRINSDFREGILNGLPIEESCYIRNCHEGINSLRLITSRKVTTRKLREIPKTCLKELKQLYKISRKTFRNKVHLLEAEIFSFEDSNAEAKASYDAAIESAECSGFIHEQGLAWELFGVHYIKIGNHENAQNAFYRAKHCYSQWGSKMKVNCITRHIEFLEISKKSI